MILYLLVIFIIPFIIEMSKSRDLVKLHKKFPIDWKCYPIIGHAYKTIGSSEAAFKNLAELSSQAYKGTHGITSIWLGRKFLIFISDPTEAVSVLKTAFDKNLAHRVTVYLLGNSVVFAPEHIWYRRRQLLASSFAPKNVKKFVSIFEENARNVTKQFDLCVGKGNISCWNFIYSASLNSNCESILDVKLTEDRNFQLKTALEESFKIAGDFLIKPWLRIDLLKLLAKSIYKTNIETILENVNEMIDKQKASIKMNLENKSKNKESGKTFKSFLELMIEGSERVQNGYTDEEMREDVFTLSLAGTDTSTTATCFIFLLLSQYPLVQEKVFKELQEVFGESNRELRYEDLPKLKYTEAVIKETLRLYPPVALMTRDSENDFTLASGITVPKKCPVVVSIYGINRNPKYWGEDADKFKPERFLSRKNPIPGSFMAFSYGARNCPGQLYAMLFLKINIAHVIRRYRLLPATSFKYDEKNPLRLSFQIITKHIDNFQLQLEYRNQELSDRRK